MRGGVDGDETKKKKTIWDDVDVVDVVFLTYSSLFDRSDSVVREALECFFDVFRVRVPQWHLFRLVVLEIRVHLCALVLVQPRGFTTRLTLVCPGPQPGGGAGP